MEKLLKQRLLGGLVLVAGAALFLPVLLDGSGAPLTVPPMPTPPQVPGVEAIAPKLEQQVQEADQSITAAHEGQTFAPEQAATTAPETAEDVVPDAAAQEVGEPVSAGAALVAAEKAAEERQRLAAEKAAQVKAAQEKALREKAMQEKLAGEKAAAATAVAKPVNTPAKDMALPQAWVVQVASLANRDKADALVQALRKKSYRAVPHQQDGVWKVVVGPELRKEVAESVRARLAADPELKLSGWVQAYKP